MTFTILISVIRKYRILPLVATRNTHKTTLALALARDVRLFKHTCHTGLVEVSVYNMNGL